MSARTTPPTTPEERDRLIYELPANVIVSAGAGTGKTHRLTGVYVHLVAGLSEVGEGRAISPDAIVATTFTREAAGEMRTRIEERLRRLAAAPLDALVAAESTAPWAQELAATCARRRVPPPPADVFRRALDALPRGTITTFHAWAGDLVRAHPIEAGVAPGFTLVEPDEADELVVRTLHRVLGRWIDDDAQLGPDAGGAPRGRAARALLAGGIERLEDAVLRALLRVAEDGLNPGAITLADDEGAASAATARRVALVSAIEALVRANVQRKPHLAAGLSELRALASAEAHERGEGSEVNEGSEPMRRFGELVKELYTACSGARSPEGGIVRGILEDMTGTIPEAATRIFDDPEATRAAMALGGAGRALLSEVASAVSAEKLRLRLLDFGDVMRRARDLLLGHPEIQASVAEGVRALLVDEFQDTNALQRDLVYLVRQAPEAIAARAPGAPALARTLRPRGLFVVGDRKQSIYGFRGADVGVFQGMALELAGEDAREALGLAALTPEDGSGTRLDAADGAGEACAGRVLSLSENRRSVDEVLRFVNAVAREDMQGHPALAAVEQVAFHEPTEALRAVRTSGTAPGEEAGDNLRVVVPMVALRAGEGDSGGGAREKGESEAGDAVSEVSRDLAACLALAGELRALLDDPASRGLPPRDGEPPLRARDVAILIKTYAILPALELALSCHGVEYTVCARRGLYRTGEAGDLEAFVRLAVDSQDRGALLAVLRGPYVALSDAGLLALVGESGLALPSETPLGESGRALRDDERMRLHRLREALEDLRRSGALLGPEEARALDHLGVERTLALLPRGEQRIGDLRRLLEVARDVDGGLAGFARHLARGRASATSIAQARKVDDARGAVFDRDDDVVRVMTVHSAKGLEFRFCAVMQLEHGGRSGEIAPLIVGRRGGALALAARVDRGVRGTFGEGGRALVARAVAAERAERQRLTYVALTRARDLLWVVAGPSSAKYGGHTAAHAIHTRMPPDPWLAARPIWVPRAGSPPPEPSGEAASPGEPPTIAAGEGPIPPARARTVVVATSLADFALCARRFRLRHVVSLGEQSPRLPSLEAIVDPAGARAHDRRGQLALFSPGQGGDETPRDFVTIDALATERGGVAGAASGALDASAHGETGELATGLPVGTAPLDPRAQGILAHLALERAPIPGALGPGAAPFVEEFLRTEGFDPTSEPGRGLGARVVRFLKSRYARSLGNDEVEVHRELPFVVPLPSGILLRGTIDLLAVRRGDGGGGRDLVEVVDYKLRAGDKRDLARYALQLRAYATAAAGLFPGAEVVAGIAFLGDGEGSPLWLEEGADLSHERVVGAIDDVAGRLLAARARNDWPPIEPSRCKAAGCGYRPLCHPAARS